MNHRYKPKGDLLENRNNPQSQLHQLVVALESGQDAGVWGGLSEDERRAMKRRAARNRARMAELNRHEIN